MPPKVLNQVAMVVILFLSGTSIALLLGGFRLPALLVSLPTASYAWFWFKFPLVEPKDGVERILRMMRKYPSNRQIQFECCECLFRIAAARTKSQRFAIRSQPGDQDKIVASDGIELTLHALECFELDEEVVARGLGAIAQLVQVDCKQHQEKQQILRTDEELFLYLIQTISRHFSNKSVAKYGLMFLNWAASTEESVKNWNAERCKLVVSIVFQLLETHQESRVIESWAICLLFELSQANSIEAVKFMMNPKLVALFIQILEQHIGEKQVQGSGLGLCSIALTRIVEYLVLDNTQGMLPSMKECKALLNNKEKERLLEQFKFSKMILTSGLFSLSHVAQLAFSTDEFVTTITKSLSSQRQVLEKLCDNAVLAGIELPQDAKRNNDDQGLAQVEQLVSDDDEDNNKTSQAVNETDSLSRNDAANQNCSKDTTQHPHNLTKSQEGDENYEGNNTELDPSTSKNSSQMLDATPWEASGHMGLRQRKGAATSSC